MHGNYSKTLWCQISDRTNIKYCNCEVYYKPTSYYGKLKTLTLLAYLISNVYVKSKNYSLENK